MFGEQSGFTIIEVLVASLLLALVAAGGAVAFTGAEGTSAIQRDRSAAEALAQQNASRLRGYTVTQLANLDQTFSPATLDGTQYTVHESASFVSDSSGAPSCTNPSADYLETTSAVSWSGMPSSMKPVTVTGLITPTYGEISSGSGVLAVQVQDPSGNAIVGMPVSAVEMSGTGSATGVTASNGCVLFGDLPTGEYTVSVAPTSGSYVDASTGQAVNSSSPDTQTDVQVSAGTTASSPNQFHLATPGAATFAFTDAFPSGVSPSPAPTATSPSVILASGSLSTPFYIVCSAQDSPGCPSVSDPDTSWDANAWTGTNVDTNGDVTLQSLAPYTYATYAGLCSSDDPSNGYGGSDGSTVVTAGGDSPMTDLTLSAIVVRLWSGTGTATVLAASTTMPKPAGSEMALPAGSELVVTDTGCGDGGTHFIGGPGVSVPSGDSYLPIASNPDLDDDINDTGLLGDPGMPDGHYTVCYQDNGKSSQATLTNSGNGEVVNLFNSSLSPGTCAT